MPWIGDRGEDKVWEGQLIPSLISWDMGGCSCLGRNRPSVKGLALYLPGLLLGLKEVEEQQPRVSQKSLCSEAGGEHKTDT